MKKNRSRNYGFPVMAALVVWILLRTVFFFGYVPSASMEPAIPGGSCIAGIRLFGELKPDDVIVFWHDGKLLVKRIAAVGGQQVPHKGELLTVPEGCCYVLGDNAEVSADSRYWADPFIEEKDVIALYMEFLNR